METSVTPLEMLRGARSHAFRTLLAIERSKWNESGRPSGEPYSEEGYREAFRVLNRLYVLGRRQDLPETVKAAA